MMTRTSPRTAGDDRGRDDGFTLIELLVVVIIIGILAAIAIPIYVNVTNNAKDSALQSDLGNAKIATAHYMHITGSSAAPAIGSALKAYGYSPGVYSGSGSAPTYAPDSTTALFCISGVSNAGTTYSISSNATLKKAACGTDKTVW